MRHLTVTLVLLVCLASAPAALADLPKNADKSIVPGESIGGVKVGMKGKDADKLWKGEGCGAKDVDVIGDLFCAFEPVETGANYYAGYVAFSIAQFPKISSVAIKSAYDTKDSFNQPPLFPAPLLKYKTQDGVGLKTPLSKLKNVYGAKLKKQPSSGSASLYELAGKKGITTSFTIQEFQGKQVISQIRIAKA